MNMDAMIAKKVSDIPDAKRALLEELIGRHLGADQQVLIMVVNPIAVPSDATRRQAAAGIRQIIAEARARADAQGITEEEADSAVEEAMAHVRRRI